MRLSTPTPHVPASTKPPELSLNLPLGGSVPLTKVFYFNYGLVFLANIRKLLGFANTLPLQFSIH